MTSTRTTSLILAGLFTASLSASATNYYVSPLGSDRLTGTSALAPWASIAKVNAADLRAGDQVYFLRGGTWRDILKPQVSGLYYGAYGTGARPIISAADQVGANLLPLWTPASSNVWSYAVSTAPAQVSFNGVVGIQVATTAAVIAPLQWAYASGRIFIYSAGYPTLKYLLPGIEASVRAESLLVTNVSGLTVEHLAFVNGGNVGVLLGTGTSGQEVFNDVVVSGAVNEGISVVAGTPAVSGSEIINNGVGLSVTGGQGFTLTNSVVSGNHGRAIYVATTAAGASIIASSNITGNSTTSPATETITNFSSYALTASNSVLLPNPYEPKIYNYSGLTDAGNNVFQSPFQKKRAANLIVVPFIDDYINLGVAQAVSAAAKTAGCTLSYAVNTKLVNTTAWTAIAKMQAAGVDIVAHTRSHSDLANNNVFTLQYTGTATSATMTINQATGLLTTYLNGSTTPDLSLDITNTYNGVIDVLGLIPAGAPYQVVIQPNQNYFTPINLANVSSVDIKTAPYLEQAGAGYLTWEIEGAQADLAANLPGYKQSAFATPFTSSNLAVENHIRDAGFSANRNGLLDSNSQPDGNWLLGQSFDVYNMGAEWLPFAFDATKATSSTAALVEGLGAGGGVIAVYSHGYDEFSLQQWTDLFAAFKADGATCMTMTQANAYIKAQGSLIPDGTKKNWIQVVPLTPDFTNTTNSPVQGVHNLLQPVVSWVSYQF